MMDFNDIDRLKKFGFTGFVPVKELWTNPKTLPEERGVYIVLDPNYLQPSFVVPGTGGWFKHKDPNVSVQVLERNWVEGARIVYIGKAGASTKEATLQDRLSAYLGFGRGLAVGHAGGRYIWQLKESHELIFAWRELPRIEPVGMERLLLMAFKAQFGKLPFANLRF